MNSRVSSRALCFLLFVFGFGQLYGQSLRMIMPPYLQAATTNSIMVLVESTTADTVFVEYGSSTSYGHIATTKSFERTSEGTFVHNVLVSGLLPNTEYHYRMHDGGSVSEDASFRTAPDPGTPFRFAWLADFRMNVSVHDSIAELAAGYRPVMSLYGGDLCYNSSYAAFKEQFFRPNELALIARVPFYNTPGNHERWSENTRAFTESPASGSGKQEYFSFDYGDVHVLVLNNEVPYNEGSPQFQFAQKDLRQTARTWKIVAAHKPAYCAGGHGEDSLMKVMTTKIFEPNKVDLVLGGHSHFFQHNLVNGVHHFVLGSVGAPLYNPKYASYTIKSAKEYDFGIFDVSPTTLSMKVYNEKNAVLDSLILTK